MNGFRRGTLYWGRLDKRRPLLVVSIDSFNTRADYLTVVPGSSRLRPMPTHVPLAAGEGGAPARTMLLCEHVQPVRKSDVEAKPIGPGLSRVRMREVEAALALLLGLEPDT